MKMSRRVFTREFKLAAIKEVESGKSVGLVARQLEIDRKTLYCWRRALKEGPTTAFSGHGRKMVSESREAELERKVGQMTMENDFLKKLLRSFEEQQAAGNGIGPYTRKSGKKRAE